MSRLIIAIVTATLLAGGSLAEARPATLSITCRQAATLVATRGAIVLSTGRHTFDRFVASEGFCLPGEWVDRAWAPTRDGNCGLYICRAGPHPLEDLFDR